MDERNAVPLGFTVRGTAEWHVSGGGYKFAMLGCLDVAADCFCS